MTAVIPDDTLTDLRQATDDVRAELVRVDAKAGTLLTLAGVALTVGLGVLTRANLPTIATLTGWATVGVVAAAAGTLATAVRPNLAGNHGFMRYVRTRPGQLVTEFVTAGPTQRLTAGAHRLVWLSQAVHRKYRRVRAAVDLLMVGIAGLALTAALAALL